MVTKVQAKREGMPISLKHTHEIMEAVKGKQLSKATNMLKKVLSKEVYIPFKKYPSKGHKQGVPAGYPQKATKQVIQIIEELRLNIKNMGFDESKVVISGYTLGRGGYPRFSSGSVYRHGKRTNLSVYSQVDQERKIVQKKGQEKPSENKEKDVSGISENKEITNQEKTTESKENNVKAVNENKEVTTPEKTTKNTDEELERLKKENKKLKETNKIKEEQKEVKDEKIEETGEEEKKKELEAEN